ncbi:STAS/SEC14 domain-containing protein [Rhodococcus sp. O3]|uniref:STAS/SEC14 domain-containing protein n=1 Tax=Rhodococcus sp. O3 TaxID=3404919 RepID=UPI003B66FA49
MLEPIRDLPDGVLGFEAVGRIEASDYENVLMPAIREVCDQGGKIRIVLVFERFDGLSPGAMWDDFRLGAEHVTRWERIALVTDLDWMITVVSLFGWLTPGEFKRFPLSERDAAIAWAAETTD